MERHYCSEHNSDEPVAGTADRVDVWLCLEYRPTWKAQALADNALSPATQSWLAGTVAGFEAVGLKCRPQFVRQPESESEAVRLLLTVDGQCYQFSGRGYQYLEQLDLPALVVACRGGQPAVLTDLAERLREPQYLVCTNGQRDLCCSRFGLPVYAKLKERVGGRAWQATHLGGHRFAPNLLTLPDACLYGRVTPGDLDGLLADTEAHRINFDHLRGRTVYPPLVQAAEAALGRQGLKLLHVEQRGADATVRFAEASARHTVELRRAEMPQRVRKNCADETEADVFPYVVI